MCGRAHLESDVSELKIRFKIPDERPLPNLRPNWNVAPTHSHPVVRYDAEHRQRSIDLLGWGLVPFWSKTGKMEFSTINARAEGIETKPMYREPFAKRRALIPFDSFYEWKKLADGTKQPYAFGLADRSVMAMAGLWDGWRDPGSGEFKRTFTIVTTTANELMEPVHNRMPVLLHEADWPMWLGEEPADQAALKGLLAPYPADEMVKWPVSSRVGSVKNNDAELILPINSA